MHLELNPQVILLQMIPFVVLIFALKAWVFDPLLDYLEERHRRIHHFSHDAKSMESDADQKATEIESRLTAARADIASLRAQLLQKAVDEERRITSEARSRADTHAEQFRTELSQAQQEATKTLRAEVEALSVDIASRVLGRAVV